MIFEVETLRQSRVSLPTRQSPRNIEQPPAPKPSASSQSSHPRASSVMGRALMAAIDAASQAQEYAASKGIAVEFGPEDYRAIAATLYIQAAKDPQLRTGEAA